MLLKLALPNYLALLSGVIAGVIDVAWIARLGSAPAAAVAVATSVENVLLGLVLLIHGGLTVVIAGRSGAAAATAIRAGWILYALLTPAVVAAGLLLREPLAALLLPDPHAADLAVDFLTILFPGLVVFYAQSVVDGIFAGHGDTRTPMRLALTANGLLLVLDPILIYGAGLGVTGAALATLIGRTIALLTGLTLLRRRGLRGAGPASVREVAAAGTPIAGDFLLRMGGALAVVAVVGRFGVTQIAAYGIGVKVLYLATMGFYALRNATTILAARTGGERGLARRAVTAALVAGTGSALLFAILADPLMRLFTTDPPVVAAGVSFLRAIGGYLVPIAVVIVLGGYLTGTGRGSRLMMITLAGMITQTALAWLLSHHFGLYGVWLAMAAAALIQLVAVLPAARSSREYAAY
ncbi:MATE family efflux transporter [Actinoplanes couchii]|uniref:Probable multidrug resistance protein NorM n=1 Tax=Actinoplanes couchii TaxID=403638 RepID=A0ABQ3X1P7_9ACTN|nr:MATE family efflux transporter [Actinoplanes couchii]MDR6316830.1 putative MATE family efflux protein [Actinoplanes couchii]GID52437.1 hypothetical protein Aco03nite_008410 [Actinoplanes couchii]